MKKGEPKIETFAEFYRLIARLRKINRELLGKLIHQKPILKRDVASLKHILRTLTGISKKRGKFVLKTESGEEAYLCLDYELEEIKRDIIFLEKGLKGLFSYIDSEDSEFVKEVERVHALLENTRFDYIFCDRDGTITNYAERYLSSTQSIYNAYFIFSILLNVKRFVLLSSAPLSDIRKVSLIRSSRLVYAGSKGLEYFDGRKTVLYPLGKRRLALVEGLSLKIDELLKRKEYRKFRLIGSGFQKKFGQISVARQDISGLISKKESKDFLNVVRQLVAKFDSKNFVVRDTGLDIEVTLTHKGRAVDFTKKDGIEFIAKNLCKKQTGNILICGDTVADLEMLTFRRNKEQTIYSVFVTRNSKMEKQVSKLRHSICVGSPDVLVAALGRLGGVGYGGI